MIFFRIYILPTALHGPSLLALSAVPDHYADSASPHDATALLSLLLSSPSAPFDPRSQDADLSPYDQGGMLDHNLLVPVLGPI